MRLRKISTPEAANAFAAEFMADYKPAVCEGTKARFDVHRPLDAGDNLEQIFTCGNLAGSQNHLHFSMIKICICLKIMKKSARNGEIKLRCTTIRWQN